MHKFIPHVHPKLFVWIIFLLLFLQQDRKKVFQNVKIECKYISCSHIWQLLRSKDATFCVDHQQVSFCLDNYLPNWEIPWKRKKQHGPFLGNEIPDGKFCGLFMHKCIPQARHLYGARRRPQKAHSLDGFETCLRPARPPRHFSPIASTSSEPGLGFLFLDFSLSLL